MERKYQPNESGQYACPVEGCTQAPYDLPQHLGMHMRRAHDIAGKPRAPKAKSERRTVLTAETVCRTVLNEVAPNGMIPVGVLDDYINWVEATRQFFEKIGAK
jgi:hypothetical protein